MEHWCSANCFQGGSVKRREALVPPNPNEFVKQAWIGIFFKMRKGTKLPVKTGSGFSRFRVGGAIPWNKHEE